jgi:hypothetical protein
MMTDYSEILSGSFVSYQLQAPSISQALLCSVVVSVPIFIDLLLDYSILSTASHEIVHWISRCIFLMSLVFRSAILYTALKLVDSASDNVLLFIVLTSFRLLCLLTAILYYMASTNLNKSVFNVRNCLVLLVVFIAHRFFAVMDALYPHRRVFYALDVALFLLSLSMLVVGGAYWTVGQRLVLKNEIGHRTNNFACSQFYILSGVSEAVVLVVINLLVDGVAGGIRNRSSESLTAAFYAQITITIIITLLPGRYAKQEALSHLADSQARRTFIRHVTGELKMPLNAMAVGLKGLGWMNDALRPYLL